VPEERPTTPLSREDCWRILGQGGVTAWFAPAGGGDGADAIAALLGARGLVTHRLREDDGHRACRIAELLAGAGVIALVSCDEARPIDRLRARERHREAGVAFLEVLGGAPDEIAAQIALLARPPETTAA
jgi:hypothetical protein